MSTNGKIDPEFVRALGSFVKDEIAKDRPGTRHIKVEGQHITVPAPDPPDLTPIMLSIENSAASSKADTAALVDRFEKAVGSIVEKMNEMMVQAIAKIADAHAKKMEAVVAALDKIASKKMPEPKERKKRKIKHTDADGKVETFEEV